MGLRKWVAATSATGVIIGLDVLVDRTGYASAVELANAENYPPRWHNHWALRRAISGLPFVGLVSPIGWTQGLPRLLAAMGCEQAVFDQVFASYEHPTPLIEMYRSAWEWVRNARLHHPATALVVETESAVGQARLAGFTNVRVQTYQEFEGAL